MEIHLTREGKLKSSMRLRQRKRKKFHIDKTTVARITKTQEYLKAESQTGNISQRKNGLLKNKMLMRLFSCG